MKKYLDFVREFQNDNEFGKYFIENQLTKHLEKNPENQTEIEHILDYLYSTKKKFELVGYKTISEKAMKWSEKLQNSASIKNKEIEDKDFSVVKEWKKDGFRFVKLISKEAYAREGKIMSHCVSSYFGEDDEIYSLRDKNNLPHATLSKSSQQIKGKGNGLIHPKYIKYVVEFLGFLKIEVRDSEMKNLGYANVEKFKKYLSEETVAELFNCKYHYKENKLLDTNGKVFACLDLWDMIPLLEEDNFSLKINFELESFIKASFKFIKGKVKLFNKKNSAAQGEFSNSAAQGNSSKSAAQGYSSKSEVKGKEAIAYACGIESKARADVGGWIVLTEIEKDGVVKNIKAVKIDGVKIKANVWYQLKNGKFVEVKN